jgi:hypothetical protein
MDHHVKVFSQKNVDKLLPFSTISCEFLSREDKQGGINLELNFRKKDYLCKLIVTGSGFVDF